jgi:glutamate racemase
VARRYLTQLLARDPAIDTLVLGCTHYPLLADVLHRAAAELAHHEVTIVDSAHAMATAATQTLEPRDDNRRGAPGTLHCYATDTSRLDELAPRFLGEPLTGFDLVDL